MLILKLACASLRRPCSMPTSPTTTFASAISPIVLALIWIPELPGTEILISLNRALTLKGPRERSPHHCSGRSRRFIIENRPCLLAGEKSGDLSAANRPGKALPMRQFRRYRGQWNWWESQSVWSQHGGRSSATHLTGRERRGLVCVANLETKHITRYENDKPWGWYIK